ncbi:iron-containing redox enzyme family protein [Candidatus Nitronereus thalassa]|uniref:Iron-containing redox enzyme family protein n=1 Tax=Candidatus Nitronereus thalassa TaxID=3020898 RepID=A0ABU3K9W3_9BACT|nr:iron-containing redox enzyme family protein [Candidatus Nitronereus thalassa]MDT7043220.1 iron-containing redox enzyme family protein [Candidatus Nitronereus thalassa]
MTQKRLTPTQFRNQLLAVMDKKHHWAWPQFAGSAISKAQLKIHFQQEYGVYVRDFPVLLARIHGTNPPMDVRRKLAENIFEEDTGKLSLGKSHPELFLTMMAGLGFQNGAFGNLTLLPASRRYRTWLDQATLNRIWLVGTAVMTIFVEGSINDRQELLHPSKARSKREIESHIKRHPLVRFHGLSPAYMDLSRAHQLVENGHRHDAYDMVVNHTTTRQDQETILTALRKSLRLWLVYRDGIARACRLTP